jgi:hypothetical protein
MDMSVDLRRLCWRFRAGRYPEGQLVEKVQGEIDRLIGEFAASRSANPAILLSCRDSVRGFNDAIKLARELLRGRQYEKCLSQVRVAGTASRKIRAALKGRREYESVASALRALRELLEPPSLRELASVQTIVQLSSEGDRLIDAERPRQAVFIINMCRQMIDVLRSTSEGLGAEAPRLKSRIDRIGELCASTNPFTAQAGRDPLTDGGVDALRHLLGERYEALVGRLLDELEVKLAPRRVFLTEYGRYRGTLHVGTYVASHLVEELRRIVAEDSWRAAAAYMQRLVIAAVASDIQALSLRTSKSTNV